MSAGIRTALSAVLRPRVMPAVLISLAAGLGSVMPVPHAAADAAPMTGSSAASAGPASLATAYVPTSTRGR
jgi:hypothetical protein